MQAPLSTPLQFLPEGFALPTWRYLLVLTVAAVAVGWVFYRRRPAVTEDHVLALAPWMVLGSVLHVLYVTGALPELVDPLAGTPSVYVTVAVLAGTTWLLADSAGLPVPKTLTAVGVAFVVPALVAALLVGLDAGSLKLFWPGIALVAAVVVSAVAWAVLNRVRPAVAVTGGVGALTVFGHTLDAVSTAVGVDVLGFGERTPLSRVIIEFGKSLPMADVVGGGWLFVLVKVLVVSGVVVLMADYVEEEPTEGYLLLGLVAAVGLGPGAHNLVLFAVA